MISIGLPGQTRRASSRDNHGNKVHAMNPTYLLKAAGYRLIWLAEGCQRPQEPQPSEPGALDLAGDRDVEWAWVAANLPADPGHVLDFGPSTSFIGLVAAMKGGKVLGIDLTPRPLTFRVDNLSCVAGDLARFDFGDRRFDTILNCSTVEHVGLGARYGGVEDADGDLKTMAIMRRLLRDSGSVMLMTIPVGRDGVHAPYHRVYGADRLPRLINGYKVRRDAYFAKRAGDNRWQQVPKAEALSVQGSERFYGLGLYVLSAA